MISLLNRLRKRVGREMLVPGAIFLTATAVFVLSASSDRANRASKTLGLAILSPLQWGSDRAAGRVASCFVWVRSVRDLRAECPWPLR